MVPLVKYRDHLWTYEHHGAILLRRPGAMAWITEAELSGLKVPDRDIENVKEQIRVGFEGLRFVGNGDWVRVR